jgi:hypothetical protein
MRTHGVQVKGHTPGRGSVTIVGKASDRIIVYSIIRLDNGLGTLTVEGKGAVPTPSFVLDFAVTDPPGEIEFGQQGILFPEGCQITTGGSGSDFSVVYEKVDRI